MCRIGSHASLLPPGEARKTAREHRSVSQVEHLERPPQSLWNRILAEPDRAPEHIALAAAKRFGPAAAYWARVAGAGKTPPKLARTARDASTCGSRGSRGPRSGAGGAVTAAPDLVALLWIQSRMVFYVAAAHGYDPHAPDAARPSCSRCSTSTRRPRRPAARSTGWASGWRRRRPSVRCARASGRAPAAGAAAKYLAKRLARHSPGGYVPFIGAPIARRAERRAPRRSSAAGRWRTTAGTSGRTSSAAVDRDRGAGHGLRVVRDEEADDLRRCRAGPPTSSGRRRAGRAVGRRVDHARQDRVGADAVVPCTPRRAPARTRAARPCRPRSRRRPRTAAAPRARRRRRRRRRRARAAAGCAARASRKAGVRFSSIMRRKSAGSVSCTQRAGGVAAHEVDHRLEVVHPGHRVRRAAAGVGEIGAHERHAIAELGLDPLALALHDPGEPRRRSRRPATRARRRCRGPPFHPPRARSCQVERGGGDSTGMQAIPSESSSNLAPPMEQATLTSTRCFVRDFVDGQEVDEVFVVSGRTVRQKRNGEPFLKLQLGDLTGSVEAVMWDGVKEAEPVCGAGTVIRVGGRFGVDARYGAGITVRALRAAAEGEYDLVDLAEGPPVPYAQMAADLEALVDTVQHPHLRELLDAAARPLDRGRPALARGAGREVLPPGLPPRAARALPLGGPGRERAGRHVPRHRPGRGRDRRAAPRHRQARGLRLDRRRPSSSRTPASCSARSRSGTSAFGPRWTRIDGFPPPPPRPCSTSSSATTASSSTAARWSRAPARPPSCTSSTTSAATSGSFDRIEKSLADGARWSAFDRGISASAYFAPSEAENRREAA